MPIIKAAIKHLRKSSKRRITNRSAKDLLKDTLKKMSKLAQQKNFKEFKEKLPQVVSLIDKAAKNNLLHKNNAARKKSALARVLARAK